MFAAEDDNPSPAEIVALATELDQLGKHYEFRTDDGAEHAFFAVDRISYRPEAAMDGWRRALEFFHAPEDFDQDIPPCGSLVTIELVSRAVFEPIVCAAASLTSNTVTTAIG